MGSSTVFVACLVGAIVIHAYNQTAQSAVWTRCSRRLCTAGFWAAVALAISLVAQGSMVPQFVRGGAGSQPWFALVFVAQLASEIALLISIVIAFKAVSAIVPKFSLGEALSAEQVKNGPSPQD